MNEIGCRNKLGNFTFCIPKDEKLTWGCNQYYFRCIDGSFSELLNCHIAGNEQCKGWVLLVNIFMPTMIIIHVLVMEQMSIWFVILLIHNAYSKYYYFFILNSSQWVTRHWGIAHLYFFSDLPRERLGFFYLSLGGCLGLPWMRDEQAIQPVVSSAGSYLDGVVLSAGYQYQPHLIQF